MTVAQQVVHLDRSTTTFVAVPHIVSSNTAVNINEFLVGERFYNAGYTGTLAIQANIEAGHVWNGHEVLGHATTQVTGMGALGSFDDHATGVGHAMGGRSTTATYPALPNQWGVGYDAALWSGAIAAVLNPDGTFGVTGLSVASTYGPIMIAGVGGQTADVTNSSWGDDEPTGFNILAIGIDGLINASGTVSVFSAGNEGPGANTVGGPGAGYNSITVAALGADSGPDPYSTVSGFSSRGPNDFMLAVSPTSGMPIPGVRAAVDIAAPGQNLTLAYTTTSSASYTNNLAGTSFSAPLVAGGAALIVDAGKSLYPGNAHALDGRVVKAVLLNSADKIPGWDNAQTLVGGVVTTTQSLDYATGAGRMNLDHAFDQYVSLGAGGLAGTTDVPGSDVPGLGNRDLGNVAPVGWDFGWVDQNSAHEYFIDIPLVGGTTFTTTLAWFADRDYGSVGDFSDVQEQHMANLDLEVFQFDNLADRNIIDTVAASISEYNVVEHLSFELPETGHYGLRVSHEGALWNFIGKTGESYGLAWHSVPIPEPNSAMLLALSALALLAFGRRRQRRQPPSLRSLSSLHATRLFRKIGY